MISDAEANREEDEIKRELIDKTNELDSTIYQVEKSVKENNDVLSQQVKDKTADAIEQAKSAVLGDDIAEIKNANDILQKAAIEISIFAQQMQTQPGDSEETQEINPDVNTTTIDADFEEASL